MALPSVSYSVIKERSRRAWRRVRLRKHHPSTLARRDIARRELARRVSEIPVSARLRVIIEHVRPSIDGGRFPIKRSVGETVEVRADIFADGHDVLVAVLRDRRVAENAEAAEIAWREISMALTAPGTDEWTAGFEVSADTATSVISSFDRRTLGMRSSEVAKTEFTSPSI